jgi:hypothetical protein
MIRDEYWVVPIGTAYGAREGWYSDVRSLSEAEARPSHPVSVEIG